MSGAQEQAWPENIIKSGSRRMGPGSLHFFKQCVYPAGRRKTKAMGRLNDATVASLFDRTVLSAFHMDHWSYDQTNRLTQRVKR